MHAGLRGRVAAIRRRAPFRFASRPPAGPAFALQVGAGLLACESPPPDYSAVTARELECLRWTAEGKTAWEVGRILGISAQTAARHLNNAARKLGCVSKHQAVVKALRTKLIA
ncbi:MAG TPA: helix-turn-helix domain-containing protein [Albitalea sp.]|nr:helix-turn-helix domain-containing protein [Albitalea sp.]